MSRSVTLWISFSSLLPTLTGMWIRHCVTPIIASYSSDFVSAVRTTFTNGSSSFFASRGSSVTRFISSLITLINTHVFSTFSSSVKIVGARF